MSSSVSIADIFPTFPASYWSLAQTPALWLADMSRGLVSLRHVFAYKAHYTCLWSPVAAWSLQALQAALQTIWNKAIFCSEGHNDQYVCISWLTVTLSVFSHNITDVRPGMSHGPVSPLTPRCQFSFMALPPVSWQNEENHNCKNGTRQRSKRCPIQLLWPQFRG